MRGRRGAGALTLVEVLVAVAVAAVVATLLVGTIALASRTAGRIVDATEEAQRRALAWQLLRQEIELAGRGLAGDGAGGSGLRLDLDAADGGADRIGVRYLDEAHRAEPLLVEAWFFAAEDGRGRPNLYRQPPAAVRQPWLLGVRGLRVRAGRRADGTVLARRELVPGAPLAALEVEILFEDAPPLRGWASAARAGELGDPEATAPDGPAGAAPSVAPTIANAGVGVAT